MASLGTPALAVLNPLDACSRNRKKESFVFEDGAANGTTVIVAAQRRNGISISVGEPVVRIEAIVAEELVNAAVKLVRTGAGDHIDHRGTGNPYSALKFVC
jgi:hypothetical protein